MEKEFVPYELAVKLKALGFDEPCLKVFNESKQPRINSESRNWNDNLKNGDTTSVPTFSQCFRWFREKYHIIGYPIFKGGKTTQTAWYDYVIYSEIEWEVDNPNQQWKTYEEAELACLEKLIELIENK